jgi:hypothetical protein
MVRSFLLSELLLLSMLLWVLPRRLSARCRLPPACC